MKQLFSSLMFYFPSLAFGRSARGHLAKKFSSAQAEDIWQKACHRQQELRQVRPKHSLGVNLLMRYMEWSCALYLVLRESGLSTEEAGELIEEANWGAFRGLTEISFRLSRLRSPMPQKRIRWMLDLLFRVVFTRPFERKLLNEGDGLWFDIRACPLADYFRSQGVPELTHYAACGLDYRMSEIWGVSLTRTRTIAEGYPLCDFRFMVKPGEPGKNTQQ